MARGQSGSLLLLCTTLSFATSCRFIPALSRLKARPHGAEKAVSRLGDVWLCGPHRVLCGDATSGEAVARTDLPYSYVDVIVQRWQAVTGEQAALDGDGRSFDQVARERSGEGPDAAA